MLRSRAPAVNAVITKRANEKLGIGIFQKAGESDIYITSIAPDSPFAGTALKVGMKIESKVPR